MEALGGATTRRAGRQRRSAAGLVALAGLSALSALAGCATVEAATGPLGTGGGSAVASGPALEALDEVPVKGRAPRTGYDRREFGDGWVDVDGNGCDTRNDVLARDLTGERFRPGTRDCVVVSGHLEEPYTPAQLEFRRGEGTSDLVQIDHLVPLSDAWQKGAQQWTREQRVDFANDPLNLLAVDGPLNGAKGDADAATWLPPNRAFRCRYVARQVAVKVAHGLWMTRAEKDASAAVLTTCPDEPLPTDGGAATISGAGEADGAGASAPPVAYASCRAVRDAGAAPIHEGDPGFDPAFDRDGDGVGCEG